MCDSGYVQVSFGAMSVVVSVWRRQRVVNECEHRVVVCVWNIYDKGVFCMISDDLNNED